MVQGTSSAKGSGEKNGYRIGSSHDAPIPTGTASSGPAGGGKLPPIVWARTDYGKIMRGDLLGAGKSVVVALIGMAVFIAIGMAIALLVTTIINALGFDPSSSY
ncbi:hypothetical protein FHR83_007316 [Actinoplanes campanulatus]|uniref:Uncharacterized protein n=1 Tax=Actinoplanes campanulatus TaxID=113559 RepID=A0A7W5AP34_9ACTN|nr:hypothetical protein [Actinoplanes campanulatus]MBB3099607.1 hypothetical protein [Actinoplanes campanulatus]GGN26239.1 hypothetical protein GCM10010109_43020 [Actinoplanes campanulatus]GID41499.1 hypothetical protein Aca09nite_80050 [Actinoplanes campanulatus]